MNVPDEVLGYMAWHGICPMCGNYEPHNRQRSGTLQDGAVTIKCRECKAVHKLSLDFIIDVGKPTGRGSGYAPVVDDGDTVASLCIDIAEYSNTISGFRIANVLGEVTDDERVGIAGCFEQTEAKMHELIEEARRHGVFPNWKAR